MPRNADDLLTARDVRACVAIAIVIGRLVDLLRRVAVDGGDARADARERALHGERGDIQLVEVRVVGCESDIH